VTPTAHDKPFFALRGLARQVGTAVVAVLIVALGGCSAYQYVSESFSAPIVLSCPKSWVIADALYLVKFQDGNRKDLTDVDYEGEIGGIELGCTTSVDKKTKVGSMDIEVSILVNATRGPANRDRKGRYDYFVSVTDSDRKVLYREAFVLSVEFPGNKTKLQIRTDPVVLSIPIEAGKSSGYYKIFTGFKLTHEQLEFNRKRMQPAPK
jgi:hypothetical protein